MKSRDQLAGTEYRYEFVTDHPESARGNMFPVRVTVTALIEGSSPQVHRPTLSAWGKHEYDAQENREGKLRNWLLHRDEGRP